jgi:copper chaperone CopZ
MKKVKMKIDGMHCASCGTNVTKSLSKIGAKDINVNVIFGKASAEVPDDTTEKQLKKAVADPGYELKEIEFE